MAGQTKVELKKSSDGKGDVLVITIPVSPKSELSAKGNRVIASTRGNKELDLLYDGKPIMLGVNAYVNEK